MSRNLLALSLTNGLAINGILDDAEACPLALTISFSETSFFCCWILYGTDIIGDEIGVWWLERQRQVERTNRRRDIVPRQV